MTKRGTVNGLPPDVREWLDKALVEGNFSGYRELAAELRERGFTITKSALHRYGQGFEERLGMVKAITDQARAFVEASPDDAGVVGEALTRAVQHKTFEVLMNLETMEMDPSKVNLAAIGKMVAALNSSSVAQKKWMTEVRERARVTAEKVSEKARKGGMSADTVNWIKANILGIASIEDKPQAAANGAEGEP